jgi:integrase
MIKSTTVVLKPARERRIERALLTLQQAQALMAAADNEWKGMILTSLHTGQRMMDIAVLTWNSINLEERTIRFYFAKQGRPFIAPMTEDLYAYYASQARPADQKAPVYPSCFKDAQGGSGRLAARFRWLQRKAGLKPVGFYSLRYTFIYGLRRLGASMPLVQQAIGDADWRYTPVPMAEVRNMLTKLPPLK